VKFSTPPQVEGETATCNIEEPSARNGNQIAIEH